MEYIQGSLKLFEHTDFNHWSIGQLASLPTVDVVKRSIPGSYRVMSRRIILGRGLKTFENASNQLVSFKAINTLPGVQIVTQHGKSVEANSTMATLTRFYKTPVWTLNPCRIVSFVKGAHYERPHTDFNGIIKTKNIQSVQQKGGSTRGVYSEVVFSTLQGHLIAGEEALRVYTENSQPISKHFATDHDSSTGVFPAVPLVSVDDKVYFEVISYSKGSGLLGRICMPFVRPLQRSFLTDCCNAMLNAVKL